MTSLLGASGEDMAVVLKGLGYRMETRPKPAEPQAASAEPALPPGPAEERPSEESAAAPAPPPVETASVEEAGAEPALEATTVEHPLPEPTPASEPPLQASIAAGASVSPAEASAVALPETGGERDAVVEPDTIEVWRLAPSRPKRGPRVRSEQPRRAKREHDGEGERRSGPGKPRGGDRKRRPPRSERQEGEQRPLWQRPPPRERAIDPDSPFAALAALKKELEKSQGE
jgi:ATP-dependent RNA helicase SUPV3L1/SUV3